MAVKVLDNIQEDLTAIIIEKDEKLKNKLLKQLTEALINSFDDQRTEAINKALDYLLSISDEKFTKSNAKFVNDILKKSLGEDLATVLKNNVRDLSDKLFKSGISDVARSLKLKLSFDVIDSQAAKILGKHTMFWILNYYSDQLQTEIDDILKGYYSEGKLIGEVASDFATKFSDKSDKGFAYFEGLAEHTTYRVNELGKINGYEKAGVEYYEIKAIMDDRTSDICREMDGVIFPVSEALSFRDQVLKLKSPEDIKSFAPWQSASKVLEYKLTGNFPTGMAIPPYHWRCRTITIAYFGNPPEISTSETFEEVSISVGKIKLNVKTYEKNLYEYLQVKFGNNAKGKKQGNFIPALKEINVNPKGFDKLGTLLHETGHLIDWNFISSDDKKSFSKLFYNNENSGQIIRMIYYRLFRYGDLYKELTLKNIENLLNGNTVIINDVAYRWSAKTINYLTSKEEIFAEAYSQFRMIGDFNKIAIDYFNYFTEITKNLINKFGKK
jgi:SPP1 gp7 family putative phage head morphogenesis protein